MRADARLRAIPRADLLRVRLDSLIAVYDRRSGQTHLLAEPLPDLIDALGDGEWVFAAFADDLAARFDLAASPGEAAVILGQRLNELAALGLVELR